MEDLLQSGAEIPAPKQAVVQPTVLDNTDTKGFSGTTKNLYSVADGEAISIDQVNDPVFSQKMMGEGFAVKPADETVVAPVDGEIVSIFPTKHAIGIKTADGIEVLVHMGIETVSMTKPASRVVVNDGQKVKAGDTLAIMDIEAVQSEGKDTTIIVVITNSERVESLTLDKSGQVAKAEKIGYIEI
ncbi:PTS glucose transporter subunit IIA [Macrococcoides bohemicum]|uniref:PTS sugar transporter subunit IIA n=1 Tax=Macrococcoides bohemicum TaxID=1903056 RepID=UPI0028B0EC23|nr:PTS glucose transporter subunit IIA [Macrococcus bohemicus]